VGQDYSTTGEVSADEVPPAKQAFLDLMALQKEGKVKHIGTSNFGVRRASPIGGSNPQLRSPWLLTPSGPLSGQSSRRRSRRA
jgi:hypothetical protein